MSWFRRLSISKKLTGGFVLVAFLAAVIGCVGIYNVVRMTEANRQMYDEVAVPLKIVGDITTTYNQLRASLRDMMLATNDKDVEQHWAKMQAQLAQIDSDNAAYRAIETNDHFDSYETDYKQIKGVLPELHTKIVAKQTAEVQKLIAVDGALGSVSARLQKSMDDFKQSKVDDALAQSQTDRSKAAGMLVLMIVIVLVCVAGALILGIALSRKIILTVREMSEAAGKLAIGDIEVSIPVRSQDELGRLAEGFRSMAENIREQSMAAKSLAEGDLSVCITPRSDRDMLGHSMLQVADSLTRFDSSMQTMIRDHQDGRIGTRIPAEQFQGAYRMLTHGVNMMAEGHIDVTRKALTCVAAFAHGNFNEPLEEFPGERIFINENVELLRRNLENITGKINHLIRAAEEGNLSERATAEGMGGDWQMMILGLNGLLDKVNEPVMESLEVLKTMSRGELGTRMTGDYHGDHALIKNALNSTLDTLQKYITDIGYVLSEMAGGNLDVRVTADYRGDFIRLRDSLTQIIAAFNDVMREFTQAADQVASGANQVSEASQTLSQGSTEQASAVEELSASIADVASQTRQNATHAGEANGMAGAAQSAATEGSRRMQQMTVAMQDINAASLSISKIIKVIDEIAFQTNILALNAAVEAARAGQHGKGFAVVAEEVRSLAARSAKAAKETTDMIESSIDKARMGSKIADETAVALTEIVKQVSGAAHLFGNIAQASNDQATAIAQINTGIHQISQVIQSSSATSEECAAASEELSGQSEVLREMVGRFRIRR